MNPAREAEADQQPDVTGRPRVSWATLVKIAFAVAVLAFGAAYVVGRRHELRAALRGAHPGWIVLAVVCAAAGQYAAVLGYRSILTALGHRFRVLVTARVYFVSQLGKYLPGAVWPIVVVAEMSRKLGVSRRAGALSAALGMVFANVVGAVVGLVLVLVGAAQHNAALWWLLLAVPAAVLCVHPNVIQAVVRFALRVTRREPLTFELRGGVLRATLSWTAVSWLLLGLQCWALVVAMGAPAWSSLAASVGGFALAYTAGTLFVPAPAGVGVREAVLGVALAGVVNHSGSFSNDKVVLVVLVSRILLAVLDFAQAGAVIVASRLAGLSRRDGTPAAGT